MGKDKADVIWLTSNGLKVTVNDLADDMLTSFLVMLMTKSF